MKQVQGMVPAQPEQRQGLNLQATSSSVLTGSNYAPSGYEGVGGDLESAGGQFPSMQTQMGAPTVCRDTPLAVKRNQTTDRHKQSVPSSIAGPSGSKPAAVAKTQEEKLNRTE